MPRGRIRTSRTHWGRSWTRPSYKPNRVLNLALSLQLDLGVLIELTLIIFLEAFDAGMRESLVSSTQGLGYCVSPSIFHWAS